MAREKTGYTFKVWYEMFDDITGDPYSHIRDTLVLIDTNK
jgi:hypothetical protein